MTGGGVARDLLQQPPVVTEGTAIADLATNGEKLGEIHRFEFVVFSRPPDGPCDSGLTSLNQQLLPSTKTAFDMLAFRQTDAKQYRWCRRLRGSGRNSCPQFRHLRRLRLVIGWESPADHAQVNVGTGRRKKTDRRKRRRVYNKPLEEDAVEENGNFRPVESVHFQIGDGRSLNVSTRFPPEAFLERPQAADPVFLPQKGAMREHHSICRQYDAKAEARHIASGVPLQLPGLGRRVH